MGNYEIKLLDCTLRDGGYINDWKWGYQRAKAIIAMLVKANVDIVEVGFLRNVEGYQPDITVCNDIRDLNYLLPEELPEKSKVMFSAMAMQSNYNIDKLLPYEGKGIELIRVTAHDYDIKEGLAFARKVKEKGYKVSINPINIMGYSDEKILEIITQVNDILPYQFSIVDTFGSMKRRDLDRIVSLVDHNLDKNIRLALHLHENMSLSYSLAQNFIDKHLNRKISVDASLMGIGRTPGNLPIELMADYLNDYRDTSYDIDYLMDAIQDYIAPLKGEMQWGYTPAYFLSARFNLHRNYAEFFLEKGDLTNRDINHILSRLQKEKATCYDVDYAESLYKDYMDNRIQDEEARKGLRDTLKGKNILIIAPGATINSHRQAILDYVSEEKPTVISLNFTPDSFDVDYTFCSNNKRFHTMVKKDTDIIATSNISDERVKYQIDYNSVSGAFDQGCNSMIMLLKLLKDMAVGKIVLAGADGYTVGGNNYFQSDLRSYAEHGNKFNIAVSQAIRQLGVAVEYLTPSAYENDRM